MSNIAIIKVNNRNYYIASDFVKYLEEVDGYYVNTGSQNINAYIKYREQGQSQTYPYISCNSFSRCRLINSSQSTDWSYITDLSKVSVPLENSVNSIYILFIMLGVMLCLLLKR